MAPRTDPHEQALLDLSNRGDKTFSFDNLSGDIGFAPTITNWAETVHVDCERFRFPTTVEEVKQLVAENDKIRCAGRFLLFLRVYVLTVHQ